MCEKITGTRLSASTPARVSGEVGRVDDDAELIHLTHDFATESGETVVPGRRSLYVANLMDAVVH